MLFVLDDAATHLERFCDGPMNLDVIERDQRCAEPLFTEALGAGVHEPDHTPKVNHFLFEKGVRSITREHRTIVCA
jgi:hypothetical protein